MPDIVCQKERKNIYLVEICGEYIYIYIWWYSNGIFIQLITKNHHGDLEKYISR